MKLRDRTALPLFLCLSLPAMSAATWMEKGPALGGRLSAMVAVAGTGVYIAYGYAGVQGLHRGGIDVSANNGATWQSITFGLAVHQGPIPYIQIDPLQSGTVYAGTYGRGVWVYDWGAGLPACAP
jgi:hypothetical protein